MVHDASKHYVSLPDFIVSMVFSIISKSCSDRIHYDLDNLRPIDSAKEIHTVSAVFISANGDKLVLPERVKSIYDNYRGGKFFHDL